VPADIILARPRTLSLSPIAFAYRFLLRADYVHSMLYIGRGKVLHTTSRHGVVVVPTPRTIYKRDRYAILRHPSLTDGDRARVVDNAMQLHGMRLDYPALVTNVPARLAGLRKPLVRLETNRVWCSRLIVRAYADAGVDIVPPDQVEHVTSEDLVRSPLLVRL
jgi:hypothetical protein